MLPLSSEYSSILPAFSSTLLGVQVTGTLRDQLLYPFPPRAVWTAASPKERCMGLHEGCTGLHGAAWGG